MYGAWITVNQAVKRAVNVYPGTANTPIARRQDAGVGTNAANGLIVGRFPVVVGFPGPFPGSVGRVISEDMSPDIRPFPGPGSSGPGALKRPLGAQRRRAAADELSSGYLHELLCKWLLAVSI